MKTVATPEIRTRGKLDIHFISIDSDNPHVLAEPFSEENIDRVKHELHSKLGHLAHEIKKSDGYVNVYTHGNSVVGVPQYVNFSRKLWDKIYFDEHQPHEEKAPDIQEDYLDHDNYNDV